MPSLQVVKGTTLSIIVDTSLEVQADPEEEESAAQSTAASNSGVSGSNAN